MKQILIIKGVSNTGKTTKINQVANWIINTYGIANTIGLDPSNFKKNSFEILTIKNLKIGINSAGDDLASVKKIESLQDDCDILISCCRSKGATYQFFYKNYIRRNGWIDIYFDSPRFPEHEKIKQVHRDDKLNNEIRCCLTGLDKL